MTCDCCQRESADMFVILYNGVEYAVPLCRKHRRMVESKDIPVSDLIYIHKANRAGVKKEFVK